MKLPRVRFTVRRLMIAVAVVASLVWAGIKGEERRSRFRELHQIHLLNKAYCKGLTWYSGPGGAHLKAAEEAAMAVGAKLLPYYTEMERKYRRAARFPWLPVWPDPPMPK